MRLLGRILNAATLAVLLGLWDGATFAPAQIVVVPGQAAGGLGQVASGWLAYRNDTTLPIVLQGSTVLPNGTERRGTPHQINPREAAWDQVIGAGPKILTIYDAKGRVLSRDTVQFVGKDLFFSIQLDIAVKGADKIVKTRLVPVPDPRLNGPVPGLQGGAANTMPAYPTLPGGLNNPVTPPSGPIVIPGFGGTPPIPPRPLPVRPGQ